MSIFFFIVIALSAINAQPYDVPQDFTEGAVRWSVPVREPGFIGATWVCEPEDEGFDRDHLTRRDIAALRRIARSGVTENDLCYAGYDLPSRQPVTGP